MLGVTSKVGFIPFSSFPQQTLYMRPLPGGLPDIFLLLSAQMTLLAQ